MSTPNKLAESIATAQSQQAMQRLRDVVELEPLLVRALDEARLQPSDSPLDAAGRLAASLRSVSDVGRLEARAMAAEARATAAEARLAESQRADASKSEASREPDAVAVPSEEDPLLKALGGQTGIWYYAPKSRELFATIENRPGARAEQDPIYKALGLERMLDHAAHFKIQYDHVCEWLAESLRERGHAVEFVPAPVKSLEAATAKVSVDYKGDSSRLNDAVRGTMLLLAEPTGAAALGAAYEILKIIIESPDVSAIHFKDHYQQPLGGGYRDWSLLLRIADFTCELQVNFKAAHEHKKGGQHRQYTFTRLANRKLLEGAMQGDAKMVQLLLRAGGSAEAEDDRGFRALHFGARHGNIEMVQVLVEAGADPLATNSAGELPLYHAVRMRFGLTAKVLAGAMKSTHLPPDLDKRGEASRLFRLSEEAKATLGTTHLLAREAAKAGLEGWDELSSLLADFVSYACYNTNSEQSDKLPSFIKSFRPINEDPRVRASVMPLAQFEKAVRASPNSKSACAVLAAQVKLALAATDEVVAERLNDPNLKATAEACMTHGRELFSKVWKETWELIEASEGKEAWSKIKAQLDEIVKTIDNRAVQLQSYKQPS